MLNSVRLPCAPGVDRRGVGVAPDDADLLRARRPSSSATIWATPAITEPVPISLAPVWTTTVPSSFIWTQHPAAPAVVSHQAQASPLPRFSPGADGQIRLPPADRLGGAGERLLQPDALQHLPAVPGVAFLEDVLQPERERGRCRGSRAISSMCDSTAKTVCGPVGPR